MQPNDLALIQVIYYDVTNEAVFQNSPLNGNFLKMTITSFLSPQMLHLEGTAYM